MNILMQQVGGIVSEGRLHVTQRNALQNPEMGFPQLRKWLSIDSMVDSDLTGGISRTG